MHTNQELIDTLIDCAKVCQMCAAACLSEKDSTMLSKCIKTDLECAEICSVTANALQRHSQVSNKLLDACAEICRICAEECEQHAEHMDHCKKCAEACRKCEAACQI